MQGDQTLDLLAAGWSRRKWLALAVFSLVAAAGLTVALSLPDIYRATANVVVEQARTEAAAPAELELRLQLMSQEILSRSRLEELIRKLDLYPSLRRDGLIEDAVARARKDIQTEAKVQPQPNGVGATIALAISYRGRDPQKVAEVANAVASLYVEEDSRIRERQAGRTAQVLKTQLDELKQSLQGQEGALAEFQDRHVGELAQEADANRANLDRLQAELRTTSDERIRAVDRRNDLLAELAKAGDAGPLAGPAPTSATARLARKKAELAEISRRFSEKYPDVIRLKEEIAALEAEEAAGNAGTAGGQTGGPAPSLRGTLRDVEAEIAGLRSEEARLRGSISDLIRRLENVPRRQRDYQQIARDYETTRDVYDSLRKRFEQAQLEEADGKSPGLSRFRILDPALVSARPAAPNRLFLLLLALAGAVAAAAAAAVAAEWLDTSFQSTEDLRAFTRVPVAASIPLIVTPGDLRSRRRRAWLVVASVLVALGAVIPAAQRVARTREGVVLMLDRGRP